MVGGFGLRHGVFRLGGLRDGFAQSRNGRILQRFVGGDGGVVDGIALHIGCQSLAQVGGTAPASLGIRIQGFQNDLRQLIVRIDGGREAFLRGLVPVGQLAVIIELVEDHAHGIGIRGEIQGLHGVEELRGRIPALVFFRQGGIAQLVQRDKAQVTDAVLLLVGNEDISGLQSHIQRACLTAHRQGGAQIKA